MLKVYTALRYTIFSIFTACNAVIAPITVWNFSQARAAGISYPFDIYLIFVGVSGLLTVFTIVFIELGRRNAVTVLMECAWTGMFLLMYLIGGSVLSATAPSAMCSGRVTRKFHDSCTSTQVILAFAWITTLIIFGYFALLMFTACLRHGENPQIWKCSIHNLHLFDSRQLRSTPTTPILPQFVGSSVSGPALAEPKPRRPVPDFVYAYRAGLSPDYEIEHFQPPPPPPPAVVSGYPNQGTLTASSFYTQAVQLALHSHRDNPPTSRALLLPPTPQLPNWPRPNVMKQSRAQTRYRDPGSSMLPGSESDPTTGTSLASLPKPGGPRQPPQSSKGQRPPPLNLSKLSTFNGTS